MLTHTPLGGVGGGCASHLSLQATKPRGNASLSIFSPQERSAVFPLRSLVLFQLPTRPELSEKSELIVTLWVAFREFRVRLKTITVRQLYSSLTRNKTRRHTGCVCSCNTELQRQNNSAEMNVSGILSWHSAGFVCLIPSLEG